MKDRNKILLMLMFLILIFCMIFFAFQSIRYEMLYDEAIKQGAENTVTALQMVVACQNLSNITSEQIKIRTIEMFILNNESEFFGRRE